MLEDGHIWTKDDRRRHKPRNDKYFLLAVLDCDEEEGKRDARHGAPRFVRSRRTFKAHMLLSWPMHPRSMTKGAMVADGRDG